MALSSQHRFRALARSAAVALSAGLFLNASQGLRAQSMQRVALPLSVAQRTGGVDAGLVPASQAVPSITVDLKRSASQQADLDALLQDQRNHASAQFHHWLTPYDFAARFAPPESSVAPVRVWLESQGLHVDSVAPGGMRLRVSGTAGQAATAFAVSLHRYAVGGTDLVQVSGTPSVPAALAQTVTAVSGLDGVAAAPDALTALEAGIESNAAAVLVGDLKNTTGSAEEIAAVLEQASAQGQTVLLTNAGAAPSRALVLSLAGQAAAAGDANSTARPSWQSALGLPADSLRATPDAAVDGDISSLAAALQSIVAKAGSRQGEVAETFYSLATRPGVFTHADSSIATGTWTATDGLGTVDVKKLIQFWPYGVTAPDSNVIVLSTRTPTHGSTITLTVTVAGSSGTPTGSVVFASKQSGTLGTVALNSSGVAVYSTKTLDAGQYGFYGTYSGDTTYAGSTSNTDTATVGQEAATVAASVPATAVGVGANIPVTVTVSSPSGVGTPTGSVIVYPYGTTIAAQTFTGTLAASTTAGTATASVSVPASNAGSFTFQANCVASTNFSCASPISFAVTEAKGTPTVTLTKAATTTASLRAFATTATTTLTATVAAATGSSTTAAAPTGTVSFMDGTTVLGTGTLSNGVATYAATLSSAAHSLTAVYVGDTNYVTATSAAVTTTSTLITTTTALSSTSGYSGAYGTSFSLLTVVTPASYTTANPTGTITISDSVLGVVGTGTVGTTGNSTIALAGLSAGTHVLTATYGGDTNYAASTSSSITVTVTQVAATLAATLSPTGSIPYGYNANLTATVTLPSGTTPPSGSVTATISGSGGTYTIAIAGTTGTAIGTGSVSFPVPPPGSYTITLSCATNVNFTCTAVTLKLTTIKGFTTTTLTTIPTAPLAGIATPVSATVANSGTGTGTYTYSGTVSFYASGKFLASGVVSSAGVATANVVFTSTVTQSLTAVYSGDTSWNGSTSTAASVTATPLPANVVVTSSTLNGISGQNITLTVAVSSGNTDATLLPSGTVTFYDTFNGIVVNLGTSALVSNGLSTAYATISTTGLRPGTHNIFAVYAGDAVFLKTTSPTIVVTIGDFALTFLPSSLNIAAGSTGTATVSVSSIGGFTGTVAVTCTPPTDSLATCTVTPTTVAAGGTVLLTIKTTAATKAALKPSRPGTQIFAASALGGLLALCCFRKRRFAALLLLLCVAMVASGGCGLQQVASSETANTGTTTGGTTTTGTPLGTLSFTVTAASVDSPVNARHTYTLPVTVQ